jgi:hypothetical protein
VTTLRKLFEIVEALEVVNKILKYLIRVSGGLRFAIGFPGEVGQGTTHSVHRPRPLGEHACLAQSGLVDGHHLSARQLKQLAIR